MNRLTTVYTAQAAASLPRAVLCAPSTEDWRRPAAAGTTSVTFHFAFDCEKDHQVKLSLLTEQFRRDFVRDVQRLDQWSREHRWQPLLVPELKVRISPEYRISKSLVPAWYGEAGHMSFPLSRIVARKAAIAHELVHVYFPNGNRLLAEGLAIYLQAEIGGNLAFPNFGHPLHTIAHACLRDIAENCETIEEATSLLSQLDAIATPSPLTLRAGLELYGEDARGQAFLYPLAGSFVQFLIESRGLERFSGLYRQTPLVPRWLNGGRPERWNEIYGLSLVVLEHEWRERLREIITPASRVRADICTESNRRE